MDNNLQKRTLSPSKMSKFGMIPVQKSQTSRAVSLNFEEQDYPHGDRISEDNDNCISIRDSNLDIEPEERKERATSVRENSPDRFVNEEIQART
jgi:hypothetical protein